ncbi:hypothetical protein [Mesoterricola sediminis]|uniref:Uncharacterized protein n=1 Tax=Mesoterricola sediminis TaxID=2927980 RepID=A0AA48H438_9BACT|nr:hypothetical protein [Mesoterricola sediminis]BDU77101.1 hypothetical protein METESE_20590 [Mesoterricola sediminis]
MPVRQRPARPLPPPGVDLGGLRACTEAVARAAASRRSGPEDPGAFRDLLARLEAARGGLPPVYRREVADPLRRALSARGGRAFQALLRRDPTREGEAGVLLDLAQAILQRREAYRPEATAALQEVVSDLYDGFLSAEDRRGVKPPDAGTTPPLVKWGRPGSGPYTWPVDATRAWGARAGVVNLPPAYATGGLVAWTALGHETGGHDILAADTGLAAEFQARTAEALAPLGHGLADYWAARMDETASDVLGILNMGPLAGLGLLVLLRALNLNAGAGPVLGSEGPADDPHPADRLRGYLAAETVALLPFRGRTAWSRYLAAEAGRDGGDLVLAGARIPLAVARRSARGMAHLLVHHRARALEGHALGAIQTWRDGDEAKVAALRETLRLGGLTAPAGCYAAHALAAGVLESLRRRADLDGVFGRTLALLAAMHADNPVWAGRNLRHRGDALRRPSPGR